MKKTKIDGTELLTNEFSTVSLGTKEIEINQRFFVESLTSTGYDIHTAIFELVANSLDAGAKEIQIFYDKEKSNLIIQDDGQGMSIKRLQEAMDLGSNGVYNDGQIGYFGVGLKSSIVNLVDPDKKSSVEIVTNNGYECVKCDWNPIKNFKKVNYFGIKTMDKRVGTTVIIQGVKKFSESPLKKNLGVHFYPTLKNEFVKIFVNEVEIISYDPLYRDSNLTQTNFVDAKVEGQTIRIFCSLIDDTQARIPWDGNDGEERVTEKSKWSYNRGGLYVNYGGQYIETGGYMKIKQPDPWDSRTRIEFTVPKTLTKSFRIKFNKTSGINNIENEKLDDLKRKIKDMFNWAKGVRKAQNQTEVSDEQREEIRELENELNKAAVQAHFQSPKTKNTVETTKEVKEKKEEESSENNKENNQSAKIIEKKLFSIKIENLGNTAVFWSLGYNNNKFVITLNEEHLWYKKIFSQMNREEKSGMLNTIAAIAFVQHNTNLSNQVDGETFWEDFWGHVSQKLKHILST